VTTLLLAMTLNLGSIVGKPLHVAKVPVRRRRPASGSFSSIKDSEDWKSMERGEAANALGYPPWMMNGAWDWALDDEAEDRYRSTSDLLVPAKYITRHVAWAREFAASAAGESALGSSGYLPTALGKPLEARIKGLSDLIMGLHLLLEEQKLNIMTPEYTSPGRADLRAVLCQISRWLKWQDFLTIYEVGMQEELDPRNDSGMSYALDEAFFTDQSQSLYLSRPSRSHRDTPLIY
jgi:anaphase-promoting complex subunit 1